MGSLHRVFVIDLEPAVPEMFRVLLASMPNLIFVGSASTTQRFIEAHRSTQPHILLFLHTGQGETVCTAAAYLRTLCPAVRLIAMLDTMAGLSPTDLLAAKLDGCLFRHELDVTIIHALYTVALGKSWFTRTVVEWLCQPPPAPVLPAAKLSKREWQVLALLADGRSNKEIAQSLTIAAHTLERHLGQLYQKLNVRSRAEAGKWYWLHHQSEK